MNSKEMNIAFLEWAIIKRGYRAFDNGHWYTPSSTIGVSSSEIFDKFIEFHPCYAVKDSSITVCPFCKNDISKVVEHEKHKCVECGRLFYAEPSRATQK